MKNKSVFLRKQIMTSLNKWKRPVLMLFSVTLSLIQHCCFFSSPSIITLPLSHCKSLLIVLPDNNSLWQWWPISGWFTGESGCRALLNEGPQSAGTDALRKLRDIIIYRRDWNTSTASIDAALLMSLSLHHRGAGSIYFGCLGPQMWTDTLVW